MTHDRFKKKVVRLLLDIDLVTRNQKLVIKILAHHSTCVNLSCLCTEQGCGVGLLYLPT